MVFILLCGAETWTLKATDVQRLTVFHNRCVHTRDEVMSDLCDIGVEDDWYQLCQDRRE